jgi:hypothetical protein
MAAGGVVTARVLGSPSSAIEAADAVSLRIAVAGGVVGAMRLLCVVSGETCVAAALFAIANSRRCCMRIISSPRGGARLVSINIPIGAATWGAATWGAAT